MLINLPPEIENASDETNTSELAMNNTLVDFLRERRYSDKGAVPIRTCKQRLNVPPGSGVTSEHMEEEEGDDIEQFEETPDKDPEPLPSSSSTSSNPNPIPLSLASRPRTSDANVARIQ